MIVEQIWTGNDYRNFNYLIACRETGEALAIDPFDHEKCLGRAKDQGWEITQILNTHEHRDHIGGNAAMIQATGAKLLAHGKAGLRIAIAGYLGSSDTFDQALTEFAERYADQNERDYEAFPEQIRSGRLQAAPESP
jgi:glyoxylase-like metal-dependent hydrolase (beta-lactamase superfamily II)